MRLYIPRTRSSCLQLAFLCLGMTSLVLFALVLFETFAPEIAASDTRVWGSTPGPASAIYPLLRATCAAFLIAVFILLVRTRVFVSTLQKRVATAAVLICIVETFISTGQTTANIAEYLFWRQHPPRSSHYYPQSPINTWNAYQVSYARLASDFFLPRPPSWIHTTSWAVRCSVTILSILLLCRPSLNIPNWKGERERMCRIVIILLCTINTIYLVYALSDYLYPSSRIHTIDTYFPDRFHPEWFVTTIRNTASPPLLLAAAAFFFYFAFKPGALYDPSRCDRCDYPLEPSFTTCPECGTKRDALNTE